MPSGDNTRKLSFEQAEELRNEYYTTNITQKELAKKYGIHSNTVWQIINKIIQKG